MNVPFIKSLFLTVTLFSLFAMDMNGQTPVKNYDNEWKKVEAAVNKGLPKSALEEVKKIYTLAKKENPVSYTHLRAHETVLDLVCRLLLEKKNTTQQ